MISSKSTIPFLDTLFSLLMVWICIILLLKVTKSDTEAAFQQNAVYLVVLQWSGNDDVDLWVRDPLGHLVGFNRREGGEGSLFSLNRDNLGTYQTEVSDETGEVITTLNEEIVAIRGTFVGEYSCNSMLYTHREKAPTKVTMRLMRVKPHGELMVKEHVLTQNGDQLTHFRFVVDKDGGIVGFNELPVQLFSSETPAPTP